MLLNHSTVTSILKLESRDRGSATISAQSYPNPVPAGRYQPTVIRYHIPVASNVQIDLYDALGRRVRELFKGHRMPGTYEVSLSPGSFASGVYYYQIRSSTGSVVRKMVFLK